MQSSSSANQRNGFRQIDDKTLQCLVCFCKLNKILKNAHSILHTKTFDDSDEMKVHRPLTNQFNQPESSSSFRSSDSQDNLRLPQKQKNRSPISQIILKCRDLRKSINKLQQIRKRSTFIILLRYFRKLKKLSPIL